MTLSIKHKKFNDSNPRGKGFPRPIRGYPLKLGMEFSATRVSLPTALQFELGYLMGDPLTLANIGLANRAKRLFTLYALGRSHDLPIENIKAAFFWAIVMPLANISCLWWMVSYLLIDASSLWPATAVCALFQLTLFTPWIARRSRFAAEVFVSVTVAVVFGTLTWMFGRASGDHYTFVPVALILFMEIGTRRPVALIICTTPLLALFWALPVWFLNPQPFTNASPLLLETIRFSNLSYLITVTLVMVFLVLRRAENAEIALASEYDRSEMLLANLVPEQIAARLKDNPGEVIADESAEVTILFGDIVGFTPRAARMRPEELVNYLNRVFSAFDVLAAHHGLEKIKTIGDAYMVAAGMPEARVGHAQAAAEMALDMLDTVARLSSEMGETIEMRIGLNTGSAVGGVIGTTKVFYDVWGDTVNTAARMESHGKAGRIQLTNGTRIALGSGYTFASRGVVEIKGIGEIETFWLTGRDIQSQPVV